MIRITPFQREKAISQGIPVDRVRCVPFLGGVKNTISGVSTWQLYHDAEAIEQTERLCFERFSCDRVIIGPNTIGISQAIGQKYACVNGLPVCQNPIIDDYRKLEPSNDYEFANLLNENSFMTFQNAAQSIQKWASSVVRVEMSIGGPLTIASQLRGTEHLLRDFRKHPDELKELLAKILTVQKHCVLLAANCGCCIAMADPVASASLIGPKLYKEFIFPITRNLCNFVRDKTGSGVSLHMCGDNKSIWDCFIKYPLYEISLDNVANLEEAATILGAHVPIAGNVDPVSIVMNGTAREIETSVHHCIQAGSKSKCGFTLATGCDVPNGTNPHQIDHFMAAALSYE